MDERKSTTIDISAERAGDTATVAVRGEVDLDSSDQLAAVLAELGDVRRVDLDLSEVEYMDSTGLRAILAARASLAEHGAEIVITRASTIVARLLEITGLGDIAGDESP